MGSVYRWLMAAGVGLAAMGLATAGERAPLDPATTPVPMPPPLVSSPPGDGASTPKKESYGVMYIPWHPEGDSVAVAVPSNLGYAPPPGSVPLVGGDFVLPPADGSKLTPKTRIVTFPSEPPETIGAPPPLKLPVGPSGAVGNVVSVERMQEDAASMRKLNQTRVKQIKALMDIGKWDEAIGLCEMVLVEDPENGEVRKLLNQAIARSSQANRKNIQSEYDRAIDEAFLSHARDAKPRMPVAGTLRPDLFAEVQRLFPRDAEMEATVDAILRQRIKEVNFTNSDLSAILSALHEVSDVNLVYRQEDVAGKPITVRVRNVTLRDLLDLICPQVGLNYTVKNGMVLLFAQGAEDARKYLSQRIVDLKYAPTRSSPPGGGGGGGGAAGGGAAGGGGGGGGAQAGEYDVVQLMTWIAENHPGWTPESKWRFEDKFNRVLLIAPPMVLDEVEKLIRSIDMPPIQVHISTHFVSVNENTLRGFGMDWSLQPWPFEPSKYEIDPRSVNPITGEEDEDYYNWLQVPSNHMGVGTGTASLGVAGADMTLGVATIINNRRLGAVLSIINNDANSQMITSPATVALNNQSALINLVETYRYPGNWEATTAGISSEYTSSQSVTLIPTDWQEKELGTKLEVFPSVGRDMRTIVLRVIPEITALERKETYQMVVDNPSSSGSSSGSTSSVHPVEQPIFSTNTLNAQAVIEDGYTLVVGGLFRDGISITTRRVPGLHRIPMIGKWLFSSENKDHSRKCLLIFVTARILTARNEFYTDNPFEDERHKRETDLIRRRPLNNTVIDDVLGDKPISPWFRRFPQGK